MPKRLAITISGAVSLGSYEAGVLYEIIDAIRQHNTHSDTLKNPDEKIVIDVITGASARGMTAAIAAQKLLFDADALLGANTNAFYLPWVKRVDLTKLLDLHGNDDGHDSILSSALVQEIAREFLTARYANGNPVSQPHPAAADKIRLGLAMSNLNGVDHSVATFGDPNGTFGYTRFQDEFRRPYTNWANEPVADLADTLDTWKQVQQAAVACGAFPFAFRVQQVQRFAEEFPKGATHSRQSLAYAYTDGGVFQNEPLGMAKAFVNDIDEHRNAESRFYLYVSPDAKSSSSDGTFIAQDATLLAAGKHLIGSIFSQARSQDWVRAEQINGQVRKFDDTALKLKNLLKDKKSNVTADTLVGPSNALLSILFAKDVTDKEKDEARKRLRDQYTPEYQDLVTTLGETRTANAWIDAILVLETSADIGHRDEMTIYTITASEDELCGELFFSFGGFFSEEFRQYDYNQGRRKAQEFLKTHANASGPKEIGPIRYVPGPVPPNSNKNLPKTKMEDLDYDLRSKLKEQIQDRAEEILSDAKITGISGWIAAKIVSSKLKALFKL